MVSAGAGPAFVAAASAAGAATSEATPNAFGQPSPDFEPELIPSDIIGETRAPELLFAIASQLVYSGGHSVAVVDDGGFATLMAEMTTAITTDLAAFARARGAEG